MIHSFPTRRSADLLRTLSEFEVGREISFFSHSLGAAPSNMGGHAKTTYGFGTKRGRPPAAQPEQSSTTSRKRTQQGMSGQALVSRQRKRATQAAPPSAARDAASTATTTVTDNAVATQPASDKQSQATVEESPNQLDRA